MGAALLSVVVPVFNEEKVIGEFFSRMTAVLQKTGMDYELLFVNDGSRDATLPLLKQAKGSDSRIKILDLSRNFGHQLAITAGLDMAQGDAVVVIDADLQDPPEIILPMLEKWREGNDIVYGRRKRRIGETIFKTFTAYVFYRLIKRISSIDIPTDVGDFRLMSKKSLKALLQLRERHRYVRGLVAWIGFRQAFVEYVRDKRYAGETKYSLTKMIKLSLDGIIAFSVLPLKLASLMGGMSIICFWGYLIYALYIKFIVGTALPGWTSLVTIMLLLGGVQLICLGIIGEYIGILHDEIKQRPIYLIAEVY